jgi:hypothetical protein
MSRVIVIVDGVWIGELAYFSADCTVSTELHDITEGPIARWGIELSYRHGA